MKTLIIEDEKAALRNLKAVINEVSAGLEIIGETDSIVDTIEWFQTHPMPELVFMDIHLADGSAFEVFEHVEVKCPIIFTTAYDEYALRAFHVNSIAYLLNRSTGMICRMHWTNWRPCAVLRADRPRLSIL